MIFCISMIDITLYTASDLREGIQSPTPLIDGVLWEGDIIMLLGNEKAGKSILAMQMAFCLTTATPFLDKYVVPKQKLVLYIQAEGKRSEFVERMNCMDNTIPVDNLRFFHIPKKFLPFDVDEYWESLIDCIREMPYPPHIIFIDPVYMCMSGDLINNKDARKFLSRVSQLSDMFNSTIVMVHHDSRPIKDRDHKAIERGDQGSYGSVFFRANVDHILYLKMNADKSRLLTCETQRSGKIMEREELVLIQPDPLCFEIKGDYSGAEETVKYNIWNPTKEKEYHTRDTLTLITQLGPSTVDKALRHLNQDKQIVKLSGKPTYYMKHPDLLDNHDTMKVQHKEAL